MACPVCDTKGLKEIDSRDTRVVTVVTYYQYKKVGSFHIISWKSESLPFHYFGVPCLRLKFLVWKKHI
jgi:hypothetical protein